MRNAATGLNIAIGDSVMHISYAEIDDSIADTITIW